MILTVEDLAYQLFLALKRHRNSVVPETLWRHIWEAPLYHHIEEKAECLAQARRLLDVVRDQGGWRLGPDLVSVARPKPPDPDDDEEDEEDDDALA